VAFGKPGSALDEACGDPEGNDRSPVAQSNYRRSPDAAFWRRRSAIGCPVCCSTASPTSARRKTSASSPGSPAYLDEQRGVERARASTTEARRTPEHRPTGGGARPLFVIRGY
jgi:hypothetical protein